MIVRAWNQLKDWTRSERGAGLVEYALLVLLIAIVAITAVSLAGDELSTQYSIIADEVTNAGN